VESAAIATRHLLQSGHRRIGLMTNASLQYTSAQQRREGYLHVLSAAGIVSEEALIREGAHTSASGYEAMQYLLESPIYVDPPLTPIRLPAFKLGWKAGEQLTKLIHGKPLEHQGELLNIELVVRESTMGRNFKEP
jgi:DNA-binding LacI/PurR family transcriptional regulator